MVLRPMSHEERRERRSKQARARRDRAAAKRREQCLQEAQQTHLIRVVGYEGASTAENARFGDPTPHAITASAGPSQVRTPTDDNTDGRIVRDGKRPAQAQIQPTEERRKIRRAQMEARLATMVAQDEQSGSPTPTQPPPHPGRLQAISVETKSALPDQSPQDKNKNTKETICIDDSPPPPDTPSIDSTGWLDKSSTASEADERDNPRAAEKEDGHPRHAAAGSDASDETRYLSIGRSPSPDLAASSAGRLSPSPRLPASGNSRTSHGSSPVAFSAAMSDASDEPGSNEPGSDEPGSDEPGSGFDVSEPWTRTPSPGRQPQEPSPSAPSVAHFSLLSSLMSSNASSSRRQSLSGLSLTSSMSGRTADRRTDGTLGTFLEAIADHETTGGTDFLDAQSDAYDNVMRKVFDTKCDCPHPPERDEPDNAHTVHERVAQLQQALPPLSKVFGDTGSYDPKVYFSQWQTVLSRQPVEPLSFRKTQAALPQRSITGTRKWDIDSIWLGATDLGAIRAPNDFRLSLFPPFTLNLSTTK